MEQLAGRLSLSERLTGPAPGLEPILAAGGERFPELGRPAADAQPRGALPPRADVHARARPRHPDPHGAAPTSSRRSCSTDLRRVEASLCRGPGRAHRRLRPARRHPPGRGVRLSLRAAGHPRARPGPPPRAGRDLRRAARLRRLRGAAPRRIAGRAAAGPDRRPPAADPHRHRPLLGAPRRRPSGPSARCATTLGGANRGAIQTYIISGTEGPADVLEVLLLMKEASLCRAAAVSGAAPGGAAVRGGRDARGGAADAMDAAAVDARLPGGAARGRRRAGDHDRLLGLQQGRRVSRPRPGPRTPPRFGSPRCSAATA